MTIIFLDLETFGNEYLERALKYNCELGAISEVIRYPFNENVGRNNPMSENKFGKNLNWTNQDFVFYLISILLSQKSAIK